MILLVDFGNSRLKWAALDGGAFTIGGVFAHVGMPLAHALLREWQALPAPGQVWVASVVAPAQEEALATLVQERFGVRARFVRTPAAALGVRNAYAQPQDLGIDRFLALVAAHARMPRAQVIASVGTALTIDALTADGAHLGGLILPSPALMRSALADATARIRTGPGSHRPWPASTADGVCSGALEAAAGAIERMCARLARHCACTPALLLCGGGSDELAPLLPGCERAHDLVLRGLALWAHAPTPT